MKGPAPTAELESALYVGHVFHQRLVPKRHSFSYKIFLFWLNLDEIDELDRKVTGFSNRRFAPSQFKRSDFLGDPKLMLKHAVLKRMNELSHSALDGDVFMLGQLRMFGLYFSPVNFYYLRNKSGYFTHLLAEVSNTPWNKRHHYLVDLNDQKPDYKRFHVSPFNPMDMLYHWSVRQPGETLNLQLSCIKETRHFTAALRMTKMSLNSRSLLRVIMSIPSMTIKTVFGIYWQALKLFVKRVPFYAYPSKNKEL